MESFLRITITLWALMLLASAISMAQGLQKVSASCFLLACSFLGLFWGWKLKDAHTLMKKNKDVSDNPKTVA